MDTTVLLKTAAWLEVNALKRVVVRLLNWVELKALTCEVVRSENLAVLSAFNAVDDSLVICAGGKVDKREVFVFRAETSLLVILAPE